MWRVGMVALLGIVAWGVFGFLSLRGAVAEANARITPTAERALSPAGPLLSSPQNTLVVGIDARPGETRSRADSIMVMRTDPGAGRVKWLSIPRDFRVDLPGVGTERRPVAVELEWGRVVIGPDNGLLGLVADRLGARRAVHVTSRDHMREPVSDTFHGRDVFAPVAAHIAEGVPLEALGPEVDPATLERPPLPAPHAAGGTLEALVAGVDSFGNLALWATADDLMAAGLVHGAGAWVSTAGAGHSRARVGRTFQDVPRGALLVYVESHGLVSVALNGGSAEERVRATSGEVVAVMRQE
jgi:S-adenosylmethionine hydrolase